MEDATLTAFGTPPPSPPPSSSDDEATLTPRPPLPPLPSHLFGYAVKKVRKRTLMELVVEKFSLYASTLPTTPPIPHAWSDDESEEEDQRESTLVGGSESADSGGEDHEETSRSVSESMSMATDSDSESVDDNNGVGKPSWLTSAIAAASSSSQSDDDDDNEGGARSGLPEYFREAGTGPGLEVWRVVKGTPTLLSADEYGTFYTGDAYIVLAVDEVEYSKVYSLFFWIGDSVPLDATLAASFAAQELGRALGARAIRVSMGDEPKKFREIFWFGIDYVEGGSASGLRKVVKKKTISLYQIKGARKPKVRKLPLQLDSLNGEDVFILDAEDVIYQWNGSGSSMREKGKALDMYTFIKSDERSGKVSQVIINAKKEPGQPLSEDESQFLSVLTGGNYDGAALGMPDLGAPEEDDKEFEARVVDSIRLHRVHETKSGKLSLEVAGGGRLLKRSILDPDAAYILDSATGIYAWVGRGSSDTQRTAAMRVAKVYHTQQERPPWQPVERVVEGAEPYLFQECFKGWHRAKARAKREAAKDALAERKARAKAARAKAQTIVTPIRSLLNETMEDDKESITDDPGGGKLTVMVLESDLIQFVLPHSLYGHLYTQDVFLVIYYYQTEETEENPAETKCVIYFWEGSAADKKIWLWFQHSPLRARLAEAMKPVLIRIRESKETPHFRSLFNGVTIVHYGHLSSFVPLPVARLLPSDAPAFTDRFGSMGADDTFNGDQLLPPSSHLWHVKGFGPDAIFVHETLVDISTLDCNDAFVGLAPHKGAFVWIGRHASEDEVAVAKFTAHEVVALANTLQLASMDESSDQDEFILSRIVMAKQGREPDEWWGLFNLETAPSVEYGTGTDPDFAPRLYDTAQTADGFVIRLQSNRGLSSGDLEPRGVHLLDVFTRVFVWVGPSAPKGDVALARQAAEEYVESAIDGRGGCTVSVVQSGSEPLLFKKQFLDWPHSHSGGTTPGGSSSSSSSFVDPRAAREARLEAEAKIRTRETEAALKAGQCTIRATGFELHVVQEWRQCVTCSLEGDMVGACLSCVAVCHAGHTLSDPKTSFFFCSCGPHLVDTCVPCLCLPPEGGGGDDLPPIPQA